MLAPSGSIVYSLIMQVTKPETAPLTQEDLPTWMRPRARKLDYMLLAACLLSFTLALPWMSRDGLPRSLLAQAEMARIAEVTDSFQSGIIYPRWASHFHFGYGSPLFNYLAPAPHYLGGLHLLMTQTSPDVSLRFWVTIFIFIAGVGMFTLGRASGGDWAGLTAMLLYLLSPTIIYRLAYIDVNLGLLMAAALFPWALWLCWLTVHGGDGRDSASFAILGALLLLSSNWLGMLLFIAVIAWGFWLLQWRLATAWRPFVVALGISIGLSSFYWMPLVLEWDAVHWQPRELLLRPLALGEVLRFPSAPDFAKLNPPSNPELGPATWGLGIAGILILAVEVRQSARLRYVLYWLPFGVVGIGLLVIATQLQDTWLDDGAKFPALTRLDLLIPTAACAALMGAQVTRAIQEYWPSLQTRMLGVALLSLLILICGYNTFNPPPFVPYRNSANINSYMQDELRGAFGATLTTGLLLPVDVQTIPSPSFALIDSFEENEVIKLERASRLPNTNLGILSHSPIYDAFRISNETPTSLEILTFNFLGWNATFRERPAAINSALGSGLIMVTVPAGDGTLEVKFSSTRVRSLALFVSVGSLLVLFGTLRILSRRPKLNWIVPTRPEFSPYFNISLAVVLWLTLMVVRGNIRSQSDLSHAMPYPHVFEGGIDFLGFQLNDTTTYPGQTMHFTLYWEAARPNLTNYWVQVHLVNTATGSRIFSTTHHAPGGWITSYWNQVQYIQDDYYLPLPQLLAAGRYEIEVEVLQCNNSQQPYECPSPLLMKAYDPRGNLVGNTITLPQSMTIQ